MYKKFSRKFLVLGLVFVFLVTAFSPTFAANKSRVWVEFSPGSRSQAQSALENFGAEFHYAFDDLNSFVVSLPDTALTALENNPNVVSIEVDPERYPIGTNQKIASFAPSLDTTGPNGQTIPWGVDAVQARDVWDTNRDGLIDSGVSAGAGKTVCIIDSGFFSAHNDLSNSNLIGGTSQVDNNYTRDGYGHGTHVTGTILGNNNTFGVVGVSPNVSLYIVKFFNDAGSATFASDLVDAANTCANNGADIISMSLGGPRSNGKENRAFKNLYNSGVLSIAAAGNDGNTAHSYPASYDWVMSVAALDENLNIADFSQQTSQVEIAAPGVGVLSTVPYLDETSFSANGQNFQANHIEFSARGNASGQLVDGGLCTSSGDWSNAVVLCERGSISFYDKVINAQNGGALAVAIFNNAPGNFFGTLGEGFSSNIVGVSLSQADGQNLLASSLGNNATVSSEFTNEVSGYAYYDGTSMATPHVSAVAALIWSAVPSASNADVRNAITQTAFDLGSAGRDNAFGYGLVQAVAALNQLGSGTSSNDAPTVSISSPSHNSTFDAGESISFQASATDNEDGNLSASIIWSSNIDGALGSGASFLAVLSDGTHTITASVTDSGNKTDTDSVSITVGGGSTGGGDLTVSVSTDQASYASRETAVISVNVVDDLGDPVAGVSVDVRIDSPSGKSYGGSNTSDSEGNVVFNFKVNNKKDGTGIYDVTATASKTGFTDGLGSTSFTSN